MEGIKIAVLTAENFKMESLDDFIRTQRITQMYVKADSAYRLIEQPFTDDWSAQRKREKAAEILRDRYVTYGILAAGRVVGFIMLEKVLRQDRMIVSSFHVSQEYRRQGLGRMLFKCAVEKGKAMGAKELYISACAAKETIDFYRAMGCVSADPIIQELADEEPTDLQMVYTIGNK